MKKTRPNRGFRLAIGTTLVVATGAAIAGLVAPAAPRVTLAGPAVPAPTVAAAAVADSTDHPGLPALDYAFRFASAITPDPKDRAKAQELAVDALAATGAWDEAIRCADQMDGWRRGVVYADLAAGLARVGRRDEAQSLLVRAEAVRVTIDGWQNPRIASRIAAARGELGDADAARALATQVATEDPEQYGGAPAAGEAARLAALGDVDAALRQLQSLEGNDKLEVAWARTSGSLALARRTDAPVKSRMAALKEARVASTPLPLERRLEALFGIATTYDAIGKRGDAKEVLREASDAIEALPPGDAARIPFLIDLGHAWAAAGAADRGRATLASVEPLIAKALVIDQPGLYARLASGYRKIPDETAARRLDTRALDAAAAMTISRPRALAIAAICRQWGTDGVTLEAPTRARLDTLLAGLGDPW
jgi:tetratricopeptide (TPR) repeat protein